MRIIGLSGKMGCGKSTVANYLLGMIPGAERLAFGDPVKRECAETYGFPVDLCYTEAGKNTTIFLADDKNPIGRDTAKVREILQLHGTNYRRKQNPRYWDDKMVAALATLRGNGVSCVVVDDCRFPSEVALLREAGAAVYRIEPYPGWEPGPNALHESETALDDYTAWDMTFAPMKGLHHLEAVAHCIVEMVSGL